MTAVVLVAREGVARSVDPDQADFKIARCLDDFLVEWRKLAEAPACENHQGVVFAKPDHPMSLGEIGALGGVARANVVLTAPELGFRVFAIEAEACDPFGREAKP